MNKCGDCKYFDDYICVNADSEYCSCMKFDDAVACEHFEEILV